MDRNTNGELTSEEQNDLESLVELSETIAIVRAQALHVSLGPNTPMSSWSEITHQVKERAQDGYEYCRMHQALQGARSTSSTIYHQVRVMGVTPRLENLYSLVLPRLQPAKIGPARSPRP